MAVFTFYGYGTGETHAKTVNIISQFSKASIAVNPQNADFKDGPTLLGTEVTANAQQGADKIIAWLQRQTDEKNTVNLAGFSRGSVTCIRIANLLKRKEIELERMVQPRAPKDQQLLERLQKIDLNMFLVDPVAGITDKSHPDSRAIPDNVNNCVTVLQKDERRRDFKPQDITRLDVVDPSKTKVSMLPMYGNHSDTTKIKADNIDSGPTILWHAMHSFLTTHGSQFPNDEIPEIINSEGNTKPLTSITKAQELLKIFSANHEQRESYYQSGLGKNKYFDGIPTPRTERSLNNHTRYYVKNSAFLVNQLERELFKLAYPKIFNYLFEKNISDPRFPNDSHCSEELVKAELAQIRDKDPALFERLKARGVGLTDKQEITLGKPQGYKTLEPCNTARQIFPDFVPPSVKAQAAEMSKLSALENEVYRFTFRYERDKSELNFSGRREKAETAQQIREEINHIVNNGPFDNAGNKIDSGDNEDREQKYQQALDKLEQHYKKLILANSTSDLIGMIGQTLANHGRSYIIQENSALNQALVDFAHANLSLVKFAVGFIGNLGFVGGPVLYGIGNSLESIGARANDIIGDIGWNPIKALASLVATTLEGVGFAIKHSFGLKLLTDTLTSGLDKVKSWLLNTINSTTISRDTRAQIQPILNDVSEQPELENNVPPSLIAPEADDTHKMKAELRRQQKEVRLNDNTPVSLVASKSERSDTPKTMQEIREEVAKLKEQQKKTEDQHEQPEIVPSTLSSTLS